MPSSALSRVSFQHEMVWNHKKSSSEIVRIGPLGRSRFARPRASSMLNMQKPNMYNIQEDVGNYAEDDAAGTGGGEKRT